MAVACVVWEWGWGTFLIAIHREGSIQYQAQRFSLNDPCLLSESSMQGTCVQFTSKKNHIFKLACKIVVSIEFSYNLSFRLSTPTHSCFVPSPHFCFDPHTVRSWSEIPGLCDSSQASEDLHFHLPFGKFKLHIFSLTTASLSFGRINVYTYTCVDIICLYTHMCNKIFIEIK